MRNINAHKMHFSQKKVDAHVCTFTIYAVFIVCICP